jgi:hypothetical protein
MLKSSLNINRPEKNTTRCNCIVISSEKKFKPQKLAQTFAFFFTYNEKSLFRFSPLCSLPFSSLQFSLNNGPIFDSRNRFFFEARPDKCRILQSVGSFQTICSRNFFKKTLKFVNIYTSHMFLKNLLSLVSMHM